MTAYETFLLIGSLCAVLAIISLASVVLDSGEMRILALMVFLASIFLFSAHASSTSGLDPYDIPPAINKFVKVFLV